MMNITSKVDGYRVLLLDGGPSEELNKAVPETDLCNFVHITDSERALEYFNDHDVDIVVLDHSPKRPCIPPLRSFKEIKPSVPVIVSTSFGSEELAVDIFRNGARDYIKKPYSGTELMNSIHNALGLHGIPFKRDNDNYLSGMSRAIDYIHKNFTGPLSLADMTREASMSISCFVRTFKRHTGHTFTSYVNSLRVERASHLLRDRELSMKEIASKCGFTNQFHYTRTFKKIMNITPSSYRKSLMNGHKGPNFRRVIIDRQESSPVNL